MPRHLPAVAVVLTAAALAPAQTPLYTSVGEDPVPHSSAADQGVRIAADPVDTLAGSRAWATGEYLLWFTRPQSVPLLVGSVPDSAVANFQPGQTLPAGTPVTQLYPDGRRIRFDAQSGFRARVGGSLTDLFGADFGGFWLQTQSNDGDFTSPGSPALFREYTRALDGSNQILYTALPGQYGGETRVTADTRAWGLDGNARFNWFRIFADRTDLLAGFRYLNLEENLVIADRIIFPSGNTLSIVDGFRARNNVYVGQAGFHSRFSGGRFTFDVRDTFGLGGANQRVEVSGLNTGPGLVPEPTGLYTQPLITGTFERTKFVATNELTLTLGFNVTQRVRAHVGYNLLWVSSVVRPGAAIDPVLNDSRIRYVASPPADPNSPRPAFEFDRASSDFWLQGVNLGVTIGF